MSRANSETLSLSTQDANQNTQPIGMDLNQNDSAINALATLGTEDLNHTSLLVRMRYPSAPVRNACVCCCGSLCLLSGGALLTGVIIKSVETLIITPPLVNKIFILPGAPGWVASLLFSIGTILKCAPNVMNENYSARTLEQLLERIPQGTYDNLYATFSNRQSNTPLGTVIRTPRPTPRGYAPPTTAQII